MAAILPKQATEKAPRVPAIKMMFWYLSDRCKWCRASSVRVNNEIAPINTAGGGSLNVLTTRLIMRV